MEQTSPRIMFKILIMMMTLVAVVLMEQIRVDAWCKRHLSPGQPTDTAPSKFTWHPNKKATRNDEDARDDIEKDHKRIFILSSSKIGSHVSKVKFLCHSFQTQITELHQFLKLLQSKNEGGKWFLRIPTHTVAKHTAPTLTHLLLKSRTHWWCKHTCTNLFTAMNRVTLHWLTVVHMHAQCAHFCPLFKVAFYFIFFEEFKSFSEFVEDPPTINFLWFENKPD